MLSFRKITQIFLGILGLHSLVFEAIKEEGRYRYSQLKYSNVFLARGAYVSDNCSFGESVKVYNRTLLSNVIVGSFSYIGGNCTLKNCTLGKFCAIGPEVKIGLGMHLVKGVISTYPGFYSASASGVLRFNTDCSISEYEPVVIGNDVWIGSRAMILDGVDVGDGAIIAAGSVVTKDVAPYTIVGGVPAKLIRERYTRAEAKELVEFAWWNKDIAFMFKNSELFLDAGAFFEFIRKERNMEVVS